MTSSNPPRRPWRLLTGATADGTIATMSWTKAHVPTLPGWKRYCREMKAAGNQTFLDGPPTRFHSRWRLAVSFRGMDLDGYGDARTRTGNDTLFRLLIAYSVADQLREVDPALSKAVSVMRDRAMADSLRSALRLDAIVENEKVSRMKAQRHFADLHTTDDVLVFARALRHIAAHGSATPWGLGIKTKAAYQAVDELSSALVEEAERSFAQFVQSRWP